MKSITLVIVDTESHELANHAIQRCINEYKFHDILILSDKIEFWNNKEIKLINKINKIEEYNKIILKDLNSLIKTDFVLIIQYDGFIIDGKIFKNYFFDYDYIGACWNTTKYSHYVGNGGFSLRSKKLLELTENFRDINYNTPEDIVICWEKRLELELSGIKFPDSNIANIFSKEYIELKETFGFHGLMHLPSVYKSNLNFLIRNLPTRVINDPNKIQELISKSSREEKINIIELLNKYHLKSYYIE